MMRVGFLSRGELGFQVLKNLLDNPEIEVPFIITCKGSPEVGRDKEDFEEIANKNKIPFYYTNSINKVQWIDLFSEARLDLVVAMFWVNTISKELIDTAKIGFLNLHGGMLPRYRGNACANWAVVNNEEFHGISSHLMVGNALDNGPIIIQDRFPIKETTTIGELMQLNTYEGIRIVLESIAMIATGDFVSSEQNESKALYCFPRIPRDGEINWELDAEVVDRLVRAAGDPYPGAYTFFSDVKDNEKIKKMIINDAHIEELHFDFCAVPGHLIRLDLGLKWGVVCGDKKILILDEVKIGTQVGSPSLFFRTVRQRMGLDTQTLLSIFSGKIQLDEEL